MPRQAIDSAAGLDVPSQCEPARLHLAPGSSSAIHWTPRAANLVC